MAEERRGARAEWAMPVLGADEPPTHAGPPQDRLPPPAPRRRNPAALSLFAVGFGVLGLGALGALGVGGFVTTTVSDSAPIYVQAEPAPPPVGEQPPAWDAGSPQVAPAELPNPLLPAAVAAPAFEAPECRIDDLSLVNHGWDSWSGHTATVITATNTSQATCLIGGWPGVRLEQGGPMALTFGQVSENVQGQPAPPQRLVMEPGHSASSTLSWRGYRSSADSTTPQRLTVRIGLDPERREVPLAEPPAPFDVVAGATIDLLPWVPATRED